MTLLRIKLHQDIEEVLTKVRSRDLTLLLLDSYGDGYLQRSHSVVMNLLAPVGQGVWLVREQL